MWRAAGVMVARCSQSPNRLCEVMLMLFCSCRSLFNGVISFWNCSSRPLTWKHLHRKYKQNNRSQITSNNLNLPRNQTKRKENQSLIKGRTLFRKTPAALTFGLLIHLNRTLQVPLIALFVLLPFQLSGSSVVQSELKSSQYIWFSYTSDFWHQLHFYTDLTHTQIKTVKQAAARQQTLLRCLDSEWTCSRGAAPHYSRFLLTEQSWCEQVSVEKFL